MKLHALLLPAMLILAACSSGNGNAPDPLVQNTTQVSFEVTVPAYQSNELQVSMDWGEFSTSINWVGDEFWSHTVELPTNTQALLSIAFLGENGGIRLRLGSFEQQYKTGSNAAEVITISADQFDTDQWDFDADGNSNLNELIAGTDPRVDEDNQLPIIDNKKMNLLFIANYFESTLSDERPYAAIDADIQHELYFGTTTTTDIDVEGNGSGTSLNYQQGFRIIAKLSDMFWKTQSNGMVHGDIRKTLDFFRNSLAKSAQTTIPTDWWSQVTVHGLAHTNTFGKP